MKICSLKCPNCNIDVRFNPNLTGVHTCSNCFKRLKILPKWQFVIFFLGVSVPFTSVLKWSGLATKSNLTALWIYLVIVFIVGFVGTSYFGRLKVIEK